MMSREQTMALLEGTTPEPWQVGNRYVNNSVYSDDGKELVANTHSSQRNYARDEQLRMQDANAALIASAPALAASHLAALDEVERLKQALWLTMHRVEEAAKMFHNTQQWDEVEWGGMVLAEWVFEPARAALEDRT